MVGGGQLARMSAAPAAALGIDFRVLATSRLESAAQVVSDVCLGAHDDEHAVLAFADGCDVVTFDHEHVPGPILEKLEARGVAVRPGPRALINAQDKAIMRRTLEGVGAPVPAWRIVESPAQAQDFAETVGYPFILKTSRGGYDGKGVWRVESASHLDAVMSQPLLPGAVWLAEAAVPFTQELSAQVARSPSGQTAAYPVVRTVQTGGICSEVVAPAPGLDPDRAVDAQRIALEIAGALDVTGMLAVEMFDTGNEFFVNELAMRPHNSGHWTIEGAVTSQFENHLRAVLDLPLGSPNVREPAAVMVNILGGDVGDLYSAYRHVFARDPGVKVHLYGKDVRPGRKVGHVTAVGSDPQSLLLRARHAADYFSGAINE
ncbi:MAG: 5-(carboxyamino)imidazole ribonucleotide synthase [Actinomycetales bacterium]|nr:5-(carboxyamino)imidazole ribonucleotide synthase [Actinomycetales bacterium]